MKNLPPKTSYTQTFGPEKISRWAVDRQLKRNQEMGLGDFYTVKEDGAETLQCVVNPNRGSGRGA